MESKKKSQAIFTKMFPCQCSAVFLSHKPIDIVADWDSMGRVITQTRGRAFQTLGRAFSFLLNPQMFGECFKSSAERFKGSTTCFETNAWPSLLIKEHIKSF